MEYWRSAQSCALSTSRLVLIEAETCEGVRVRVRLRVR
jgi:hypothetical protein